MDQNQPRKISTTEIDLESVLQVRRRRLSVTAPHASQDAHRYTDVIFLKVEKSNDILKEDARCIFHGQSWNTRLRCTLMANLLPRRLSCDHGYLSEIHVAHQNPSRRSRTDQKSWSSVREDLRHSRIANHVLDWSAGDSTQAFLLHCGEFQSFRSNKQITGVHSSAQQRFQWQWPSIANSWHEISLIASSKSHENFAINRIELDILSWFQIISKCSSPSSFSLDLFSLASL